MVASPELSLRITQYLDVLQDSVEDLAEMEAEWPTLPEGARVASAVHWDQRMADYLTELGQHLEADNMRADQQARYHSVLRKLQERGPIFQRLNLHLPPGVLGTGGGTA
jgi:hypothetical protein